jgi:hypothetical protein
MSLSETKPANPSVDDNHNAQLVVLSVARTPELHPAGGDEPADPNFDPPRAFDFTNANYPFKLAIQRQSRRCKHSLSNAPVPMPHSLVFWPSIVVGQEQVGEGGPSFKKSDRVLDLDFDAHSLHLPDPPLISPGNPSKWWMVV